MEDVTVAATQIAQPKTGVGATRAPLIAVRRVQRADTAVAAATVRATGLTFTRRRAAGVVRGADLARRAVAAVAAAAVRPTLPRLTHREGTGAVDADLSAATEPAGATAAIGATGLAVARGEAALALEIADALVAGAARATAAIRPADLAHAVGLARLIVGAVDGEGTRRIRRGHRAAPVVALLRGPAAERPRRLGVARAVHLLELVVLAPLDHRAIAAALVGDRAAGILTLALHAVPTIGAATDAATAVAAAAGEAVTLGFTAGVVEADLAHHACPTGAAAAIVAARFAFTGRQAADADGQADLVLVARTAGAVTAIVAAGPPIASGRTAVALTLDTGQASRAAAGAAAAIASAAGSVEAAGLAGGAHDERSVGSARGVEEGEAVVVVLGATVVPRRVGARAREPAADVGRIVVGAVHGVDAIVSTHRQRGAVAAADLGDTIAHVGHARAPDAARGVQRAAAAGAAAAVVSADLVYAVRRALLGDARVLGAAGLPGFAAIDVGLRVVTVRIVRSAVTVTAIARVQVGRVAYPTLDALPDIVTVRPLAAGPAVRAAAVGAALLALAAGDALTHAVALGVTRLPGLAAVDAGLRVVTVWIVRSAVAVTAIARALVYGIARPADLARPSHAAPLGARTAGAAAAVVAALGDRAGLELASALNAGLAAGAQPAGAAAAVVSAGLAIAGGGAAFIRRSTYLPLIAFTADTTTAVRRAGLAVAHLERAGALDAGLSTPALAAGAAAAVCAAGLAFALRRAACAVGRADALGALAAGAVTAVGSTLPVGAVGLAGPTAHGVRARGVLAGLLVVAAVPARVHPAAEPVGRAVDATQDPVLAPPRQAAFTAALKAQAPAADTDDLAAGVDAPADRCAGAVDAGRARYTAALSAAAVGDSAGQAAALARAALAFGAHVALGARAAGTTAAVVTTDLAVALGRAAVALVALLTFGAGAA